MPFVIESSLRTATTSVSTSHTLNLPSSIVAGELLMILISSNSNKDFSATGYTAVTGIGSGSGRIVGCLYKIASGSEGSTVSVTTTGSGALYSVASRVSGINGSAPTNSNNFIVGTTANLSTFTIPANTLSGMTSGSGLMGFIYSNASRGNTSFDADLTEIDSFTGSPISQHSYVDNDVGGSGNPAYDFTMSGSRQFDYFFIEVAASASGATIIPQIMHHRRQQQ
jgi:hypothetical protein